ncbi:MAG: hypothetical protein AAFW66_03220, partial [Pseudomonadota bacterium]
ELTEEINFGGLIVPPQNDRERYKEFSVVVERDDKLLKVEVKGPQSISLKGAKLSLYPVDHEDVAIAIEIIT